MPPQSVNWTLLQKLKWLVEKYERRASLGASLFGFLTDVFTLTRIDHWITEALLFTYLAVALVGIFFLAFLNEKKLSPWWGRFQPIAIIALQFAFGGLFGRYFLHYFGSASLFTSWPFILILAALLVGNEFARKYYDLFAFNIGILYVSLLFFLTFYIPVLVGRMGDLIFVFSGIISLIAIGGILKVAANYIPELIAKNRIVLITIIFCVFTTTNVLYFTRIIPPLPLGLHDVGVFYSVKKTTDGYVVEEALQSDNRLRKLLGLRPTVYLVQGMPVYVYSAVFAPVNFGTNIVHHWEHYSTSSDTWVEGGKITFPIVGGEDRGYRGYSQKNIVEGGLWRVNIETQNGLVIGRTSFYVEYTNQLPILVSDTL